jgi:hypothetical protein
MFFQKWIANDVAYNVDNMTLEYKKLVMVTTFEFDLLVRPTWPTWEIIDVLQQGT